MTAVSTHPRSGSSRTAPFAVRASEATTFPVTGSIAELHQHHLTAVIRHRDIGSFIALFNYFAPRVKAFMRKLGAADDVAEELAQDVMFTVWRKAASYDPAKSAVSSWIYTIARNLRIDALRREQRHAIDTDDPLLEPLPAAQPDLYLQAAQQHQCVRAALTALPREQAAVVTLAFYQGKSHGEIAATLAIPLGTVKSRMRLAFQRLRSTLDENAQPRSLAALSPVATKPAAAYAAV